MASRRLIVAIDYGTSNSGVAYALYDKRRSDTSVEIEIINKWPDRGSGRNASSDKVPSDIAYDAHGARIGCGFETTGDNSALQWVKLLLEPVYLKEKAPNTSKLWQSYNTLGSRHLGKKPVDAVADYLEWLWARVQLEITEQEAEPDLFETVDLTVVLTVPVSWSERAKSSMEKAARMAGIPCDNLRILSEPEAAAVWGLKRQVKRGAVQENDCVIICDAGGGTVDVVAYQVHSEDPLTLDQVTVSQGDFCGSQFVNQEFMNQLHFILGPDFDRLSPETKLRIEDEFENDIKRTYNPAKEKKYHIHVHGIEDDDEKHIYRGRMRLDAAVLRESFESVMTQVMTLIDGQVEMLQSKGLKPHLKGILLVGGFSASEYLHQRMREEYPDKNDLKIWRVDSTWTAVPRGAVAHEISGTLHGAVVRTRISAYNYGIPHLQGRREKVQWLVRKGESMRAGMSTAPYSLRIEDEDWLDQSEYCLIEVNVVRSDEDEPTDDYTHRCHPHARLDCRVPTSLRYSPAAKPIRNASLKRAFDIPANLEMVLDGALVGFRCKINDTDVSSPEVTYIKTSTEQPALPPIYDEPENLPTRFSVVSTPPMGDGEDLARRDSFSLGEGGDAPPNSPKSSRFSGGQGSNGNRRSLGLSIFSNRTKRDSRNSKSFKAPIKFDPNGFVPPPGLPSSFDKSEADESDQLWPGVF